MQESLASRTLIEVKLNKWTNNGPIKDMVTIESSKLEVFFLAWNITLCSCSAVTGGATCAESGRNDAITQDRPRIRKMFTSTTRPRHSCELSLVHSNNGGNLKVQGWSLEEDVIPLSVKVTSARLCPTLSLRVTNIYSSWYQVLCWRLVMYIQT